MLGRSFPELIALVITLVISFSVHEFAHAWTADYFGDDTPRSQGRLTLNPLVHLDPMGSLLLLIAGFGWARPVIINPIVLRQSSPSAPMLVALAGPVSNLFLAFLAAVPFQAGFIQLGTMSGGILPSAFLLISIFVQINLLLMFFNLIPLAPLDGEKVLSYFLPPAGRAFMDNIRPYSPMLLMGIIFLAPGILQFLIIGPQRALYSLIMGF